MSPSPNPTSPTYSATTTTLRPIKRRRVYTGCLVCRRRKIKCGEEHPVCDNCTRTGLVCEWDLSATSSGPTYPRGQTRRACNPCRSSKSACSFIRPICATCSRRKVTCTWSSSSGVVVVAPSNQTTEQERLLSLVEAPPVFHSMSLTADELARVEQREETVGELLPLSPTPHILQDGNVQRLIAVYFFRVYNVTWHGFLHKATFLQRLRKGEIPRHLLTSVCLSAAIVLGSLDYEDGKRRLAGSLQQIGEAMVTPTLDLLATIINTIYCELALGRTASVWMLSGMANRIALVHQLTTASAAENDALPPTTLEIRHRLMWACFCIDLACTQHSPELAQFSLESVGQIALPANERRFLLRQRGKTRRLRLPWVHPTAEHAQEEGMPAQNVIVFALCQQVIQYRASSFPDSPRSPDSQFQTIYANLMGWRASLNESLEYIEEENVFTRLEMGQLTALFALHVRYAWALGTLLSVVLQRYDARADGRDSDARSSWHREIMVQHSQAWDIVPEVGAAIVAIMPEFVPEDPLSTVAEILVTAVEVQISMAAMTPLPPPPTTTRIADPKGLSSRVSVLVDLLVRMAKPFFGTRTQLVNLLQRQDGTLHILLGDQKMNGLRREFAWPGMMGDPMAPPGIMNTTQNTARTQLQLPVAPMLTANERSLDSTGPATTSTRNLGGPSAPTGSQPDFFAQQLFLNNLFTAKDQDVASPIDYADFEFALPLYQMANADASSSSTMSRAPEQEAGQVISREDEWDMAGYAALSNDAVYQAYM